MTDTNTPATPLPESPHAVPTPAECWARAAEALSNAIEDRSGVAHAWMNLAVATADRGPAQPITTDALRLSTVEALADTARQYPGAFARAVHQLIAEHEAQTQEAAARWLSLKAESEQIAAEARKLREQARDMRAQHEADTETIRTLQDDLTKLSEVGSQDADAARAATARAEEYGRMIGESNTARREATYDARRFKADYEGACKTVADMHAAAFGGVVKGPDRGVVEDIADLYHRAQAAREALTYARETEDKYRRRAYHAEERVRALETGIHGIAAMAHSEARAQAPARVVAHYVAVAALHLTSGHDGDAQGCTGCNIDAARPHPTEPVDATTMEQAPQPAVDGEGWPADGLRAAALAFSNTVATARELFPEAKIPEVNLPVPLGHAMDALLYSLHSSRERSSLRNKQAQDEAAGLRRQAGDAHEAAEEMRVRLEGAHATNEALTRRLTSAERERDTVREAWVALNANAKVVTDRDAPMRRLAAFIAGQYPDYANGDTASAAIDLLNTYAARTAALSSAARTLIGQVRTVSTPDSQPSRWMLHAAGTLADLLDTPVPTPALAHKVPPVGRPTTVAALAYGDAIASQSINTPAGQINMHYYDPEPARTAWQQALRAERTRWVR